MKDSLYSLALYAIGLLGGMGIGAAAALDLPWWAGTLFAAASGIAHGILIGRYRRMLTESV